MIVTEARLAANRLNGLKGGPVTESGKENSRRNSLKHGLSGAGIVVPQGDVEEIKRRAEALTADMNPKTPASAILITVMATLSVRAERAAEQVIAETDMRVRNAADAFDEERIARAYELFGGLANDPRTNLRKLKKRSCIILSVNSPGLETAGHRRFPWKVRTNPRETTDDDPPDTSYCLGSDHGTPRRAWI